MMAEPEGTISYHVDVNTDALLIGNKAADDSLDKLQDGFDKTDSAARKFGAGAGAAANKIKPLPAEIRRVNAEAAAAQTSLSGLAKILGTVVGVRTIADAVTMAESYNEMAERVAMATKSYEDYATVQERLLANANATYRALGEAQELFITTSSSIQSMGYSLSQTLDITDSFALSLVRNAASAERGSAAISALSKSLNTNKVAADQWETITSAMPTIISDIANATGRAEEEIRRLGSTGKLTGRDLTEGLRQSLEANTEAAANMAVKVSDAWQNIINNLSVYLGEANRAQGATGLLSGALEGLGNNIALIANLVGTVGAGAVTAFAAQSVIAATNSVKASLASRQQAVAELAKANELVKSTAATVAAARANAQLGGSTAAVTAATNAHTAALKAQAAAQAGVASGGRLLLGALGGPVGIIAMVASAAAGFLLFKDNAKEAADATDTLSKAVTELSAAEARRESRKNESRIEEINKEILQTQKLIALTTRMQNVSFTKQREEKLDEHIVTIERLQKELDMLTARQAAIAGTESGQTTDEAPTITSSQTGQDAIVRLTKELELIRATGVAKARLAELQKLGADATAEERSEIEKLVTQIYEYEEQQKKSTESAKKKSDAEKANAEVLKDLRESLQLAALAGEKLAEAKAVAKLNSFASPEDIENAKALARELYALEQTEERRGKFGKTSKEATDYITGSPDPLSGGAFDTQFSRYAAEAAAEEKRYADAQDRLKEARELAIRTTQEYDALEEQMAKTHADRMSQIEQAKTQLIMQSGQDMFASLADAAKNYAGEQSSTYRAMFAASKAFAIAQASVAIYTGIAQAAATSFPANLAAMASVAAATASIISNISSVSYGGGRFTGGPVEGGSAYRVNEGGAPEVFNAKNGHQYLLPNTAGEVVSNKNATGGATIQNIITIQISDGSASVSQSGPDSDGAAALGDSLRRLVLDEMERQGRPGGYLWRMQNG